MGFPEPPKEPYGHIFWDIETTGFHANKDIMLVACIKPIGKPVVVFRIDHSPHYKEKPWDDKAMLIALKRHLKKADIWVTYYGRGFDRKFVDTRLIGYGLNPIPPVKHIDLYSYAKYRLLLTNKRRMTVHSHIQGKQNLSEHNWRDWTRAQTGNSKAISSIVKHCKRDVIELEQDYKILGKLVLRVYP